MEQAGWSGDADVVRVIAEGHLAEALSAGGHEAVLLARGVDQRPWAQEVMGLPGVSFFKVGVGDQRGLVNAFAGCDAVAHCAGINREVGSQTYEAVHVRGTTNVVRATEEAGVRRVAMVSFLRARPGCGSAYHESKWAAEEIIRASRCEWTVLKPGMMFGRGDHMLDHLSHALYTFPVFLGIGARRVRPLAVGDTVGALMAALVEGRLAYQTVGLVGPSEIGFDDAARLVADVIGKRRPAGVQSRRQSPQGLTRPCPSGRRMTGRVFSAPRWGTGERVPGPGKPKRIEGR